MANSITDLLTEVGLAGSVTTLASPGKAIGAPSINVGSTANWPSTGKAVFFAMRTVNPTTVSSTNPSGQVPGTYSEWKGLVGTNTITNLVLQAGSTDQVYTAGSNTQVFIPVTAPRENALVSWGQVHADNQGNLLQSAVQSALGLTSLNGYTPLGQTFSSVVYNGNRSYTCTVSGTDVTNVLSPGMRLRTTRTVAAPTQSTALNGTTQFWSRTSPTGMTFTNNFVVSAWVKLSSYSASSFIARYNGTSGWSFEMNSSGQIFLMGRNGAAGNFRQILSYQSLPLNKWVHISAVLDMSGWTTATNFIYIDGVSVPISLNSSGTNPTSLIQAGDLYIGRYADSAGGFFPGKIAQAAIFSAVLPQATIQSYISQGLAGTEPNLVSAYSFNGSANDLNTNANNLTANSSVTATAADSPFGGQAGGAISSTLDYGIVQSVSFSTNTTVVVQVPEGCTIPTSGGVSAVVYSSNKVPYGFPGQRGKWKIKSIYRTQVSQNPATVSTFYNIGSYKLNVPIGEWVLNMRVPFLFTAAANGAWTANTSLSTSTTATSDPELAATINGASTQQGAVTMTATNSASASVATDYFQISQFTQNTGGGAVQLFMLADAAPAVLEAEIAYL